VADALEEIALEEAERSLGGSDVVAAHFLDALDDVVESMLVIDRPYVVVGGIASSVLGRPRFTHDIDLLLRPADARVVLAELARRDFETEERAPHWLFKAHRHGVEVDLIFRSSGDVYLDDEVLAHAVIGSFEGRTLPLMSREDLIVTKALAHQEHSPRHWYDALALLATGDLDWGYLVERSRRGPRRVASLLLYAQANDLAVPSFVVRQMLSEIDPGWFAGAGPA
jgi:hypothetical protein